MSTDALQAALQFTADDLVANRGGALSATQRARLTKARGQGRVFNVIMAVVFVVIIIVIAAVVLPSTLAPQAAGSSAISPGIIVLVLVVVVGIIGFSLLRTRRGLNRLTGPVLSVTGVAKTTARAFAEETTVGMVFRVKVGDVTFPVLGPAQVAAFEDGKTYRAYYVKSTLPVIIAAELA